MDDLSTIRSEALDAVQAAADLGALEAARVAVLGKKGSVTGLMKTLGGLAPEQRKEFGARVNQVATKTVDDMAKHRTDETAAVGNLTIFDDPTPRVTDPQTGDPYPPIQ